MLKTLELLKRSSNRLIRIHGMFDNQEIDQRNARLLFLKELQIHRNLLDKLQDDFSKKEY